MSMEINSEKSFASEVQNSFENSNSIISPPIQEKTRNVAKRSFREMASLEAEPILPLPPVKRARLILEQPRLLRPNRFLDLPEKQKEIPCDGVFSLSRGRALPFHRKVLSKASPVFSAMFSKENNFIESDEKAVIPLNFAPDERIRQILQYIYTGNIKLGKKDLIETCDLADMWLLDDLVKKCRKSLAKTLRVDNCLSLLKNKVSSANDEILAFILANAQRVLRHESFMKLSPELLMMILDHDELNIRNEFQTIDVLNDWARANTTVLELPSEVLRKPVSDGKSLMDCVRFENIDMKTLWTRMDCMFLLSDSEMADITRMKFKQNGSRSYGIREPREKRKYDHRTFYPDFNFSNFERKHFKEKIDGSFWVGENYYWKISNAREWLNQKLQGTEWESQELQFEQKNGGECEYKLFCESDEEKNLVFGLKGEDLKFKAGPNGWGGDEEANREVSIEFSLINHRDCRKHLHSIKKVEIEEGSVAEDELLHPDDEEFAIGVKTLPIAKLLDSRKGWIQNDELILSARVDIQDR